MGEQAWPPWFERVGSRHNSWWQEVLIFIPLGMLSVVFANADQMTSATDLLKWMVVSLAGSLTGSLFFGLLIVLITIRLGEGIVVGPAVVIASGLLTGTAFGLGVIGAELAFGLPVSEPLWIYLSGSAIIIGWLGIAISLVLDARIRIRAARARLIEEAIALELVQITTTNIVEEIREQVTDSVESSLVHARTALDARIAQSEISSPTSHWPQLSQALRRTASDTVRPLSKELWAAASEPFHNSKPWSIIRFVLDHQPLRPLAVSVIFVVGSGSQIVRQEGTVDGIFTLVLSIVLIAAIMGVANLLMRKHPNHHARIFLGAVTVLQVPVVLNFLISPSQDDVTSSVLELFGTVMAGVVVVFMTSAFGALLKLNMEQISQVSAEIDHEFIQASARNRALAEVLREAGSILHGSIQGRLLACAMSVEQAGQANDIEQMNDALERARQELEQPLPALNLPKLAVTLSEELDRHSALWDGLCDVTVEIDPTVPDLSESTIKQCGLVVEEAISNAIRHGDARAVSVLVEREPEATTADSSCLRIIVHNDGRGLTEGALVAGIGLSMIADLATSWTLTSADGQARLEVRLTAN